MERILGHDDKVGYSSLKVRTSTLDVLLHFIGGVAYIKNQCVCNSRL